MLKTLCCIGLFLPMGLFSQHIVYLCSGQHSVVFHKSLNCKGLEACRARIISVPRSEAKTAYRRRHCYLCYTLFPNQKKTFKNVP